MLIGADLLAKVKELGDASKSDIVRACGYVSEKKDGTERLNFTAFYEALLNAKGVSCTEYDTPMDRAKRAEMEARPPGARTVPQIFVDDVPYGGCDDIHALDAAGKLDAILGL